MTQQTIILSMSGTYKLYFHTGKIMYIKVLFSSKSQCIVKCGFEVQIQISDL